MKTKFNNQYTRLLKPLLTGPGFTPPTGTEWEDMVYPLMWAVYKDDHKKKYDIGEQEEIHVKGASSKEAVRRVRRAYRRWPTTGTHQEPR